MPLPSPVHALTVGVVLKCHSPTALISLLAWRKQTGERLASTRCPGAPLAVVTVATCYCMTKLWKTKEVAHRCSLNHQCYRCYGRQPRARTTFRRVVSCSWHCHLFQLLCLLLGQIHEELWRAQMEDCCLLLEVEAPPDNHFRRSVARNST